jgi:sirohydrochlorin cobaltochelatase
MQHVSTESTSHANVTFHVLLAHGSRDPQWPAAIQAIESRIKEVDPCAHVCCAYVELMEPTLMTAIDQLIDAGAQSVAVWPMFLGMGRHMRADLPRLVAEVHEHSQARNKHVTITLQKQIVEYAPVVDAIVNVITGKNIDRSTTLSE